MKIEMSARETPTRAPVSKAISSTHPIGNGRGGGGGRRDPVGAGRPCTACARSASDTIRSGSISHPVYVRGTQPRPGRSAIALATEASARLAVDFTAPRLIPVDSAISASDSPP